MIVCGIATLKDREESLKKTIESIYDQVDVIYVVLNLYGDIPQWITELPKVRPVLGHNTFSDSSKVLFAPLYDEGYYLTLDDDLVVPRGYAEFMIDGIKKYNCIVTLHGRRFPGYKVKSFLRDARINVSCLQQSGYDIKVTVGGSGCMAWDMSQFKISVDDFPLPNMADMWISIAAKKQGVGLMTLAHPKGYIKHTDHGESTIWHSYTKHNDLLLTTLVNSIL